MTQVQTSIALGEEPASVVEELGPKCVVVEIGDERVGDVADDGAGDLRGRNGVYVLATNSRCRRPTPRRM
jgi:hypothetical protein